MRRMFALSFVVAAASAILACSSSSSEDVAPAEDVDQSEDELRKPSECEEITLADLTTTPADNDSYDRQPDIRTTKVAVGDGTKADLFAFYIDADAEHGGTNLTRPTNSRLCSNCGTLSEDRVVNEAGAASYTRRYFTVSGKVRIDSAPTPYQLKGSIRGVRFEEGTTNGYSRITYTPSGKCLWLRKADFDTRRPGGCKPFKHGECRRNETCMPTNAIGTDGICTKTGDVGEGEECQLTPSTSPDGAPGPRSWDSNCARGLRCISGSSAPPRCRKLCDVLSDNPGCPADTHCGGGYNICLTQEEGLATSGLDPALVGQSCAARALYCGGAARPGTCTPVSFAEPDGESKCGAWTTSFSDCSKRGLVAGYTAYKNGRDRSTGFCYATYGDE